MTAPIEYLDLEDLLALARRLLGDPPPVRDAGLLASAVARPRTSIAGVDVYPDLIEKAAALLQSLVGNHALVDGNKRLGWLATAVFLELNDVRVADLDNDDVVDLVLWVAASTRDLADISARLRSLVTH